MDAANDGRWMTFVELSQHRGISEPSARKLVRRHKWRRQAGNQGIVRILVPVEALHRPKDGPRTDLAPGSGSVLPPDPGTVPRPDPRTLLSDTQHAIGALSPPCLPSASNWTKRTVGPIGRKFGPMRPNSGLSGSEPGPMFSMARSRTSASSSPDAQASAAELQRALDAAQADVEQVTQGRETARRGPRSYGPSLTNCRCSSPPGTR